MVPTANDQPLDDAGDALGPDENSPTRRVAALLLTGGASRRMGRDKTSLEREGQTLAQRSALVLRRVAPLALEVGPGRSGLDAVREEPAGGGPLVAVVAGHLELRRRGHQGSVVVVASDLPLLTADFLRFLVNYDAAGTVLPVVDGRAQPLCAKWGREDLDAAHRLLAAGERSLQFLSYSPYVTLLDESQWSPHATREMFTDVDTPDDARRLGWWD